MGLTGGLGAARPARGMAGLKVSRPSVFDGEPSDAGDPNRSGPRWPMAGELAVSEAPDFFTAVEI